MEHLQSLTWLNLLFYLGNALWILEFIFFRNRQPNGTYQERKSFWLLSLTIMFTIILTIQLSRLDLGSGVQSPTYPIYQYLGLTFYGIGLWLRYQGSTILGQHFTRHVTVSKDMVLRSHGPYRYLRHPLYLGLLLITIAFPLYVGSWLACLIATPLLITAFLWRMHLEETALLKVHPEYAAWRQSRYRIIPFIY